MKDYVLENRTAEGIASNNYLANYFILTKPGIVSLVLISTLTGLCLGSRGLPDLWLSIWVMIGVGIVTAGSAILNNYIDRDIDAIMERTRQRALAVETLSPGSTILTGIMFVLSGVVLMEITVNWIATFLTASAAFGYVVIYTLILKRRTSFANQIGGMAGALPPVIGYVAVTGQIDIYVLMLFAILAVWQQPHALSIALKYKDEYAKVCVPVVPVAKGVQSTKIRIAVYTIVLFLLTLIPFFIHMAGIVYLGMAIVLGLYYIYLAFRFHISTKDHDMFLFFFSIIYITILFGTMILNGVQV